MVAEVAAEAEDVAWDAAMALMPEENGNLIDTVAATDREYPFYPLIFQVQQICWKTFLCVFMYVP